jgi:hypothetical protein
MHHQKQELDVALAAIIKRIGALFARGQASGERPAWLEIEALLTDGYALALGLEAERARRESIGAGFSIIERDIRWLRSILDELHVQGRRYRGRLASTRVLAASDDRIRPVDE